MSLLTAAESVLDVEEGATGTMLREVASYRVPFLQLEGHVEMRRRAIC